MTQKFVRHEDGIMHLVPLIVIAVVSIAVVSSVIAAKLSRDAQKSQQAEQAATSQVSNVANKDEPKPTEAQTVQTPAPTPMQSQSPNTTTTQTQQTTPAPNIKHPTQANCINQSFTVYASASGGAKEYYQANTNSQVYRTVPYGQAITVICGNYSTSGWALSGNNHVRFEDVSLTKP